AWCRRSAARLAHSTSPRLFPVVGMAALVLLLPLAFAVTGGPASLAAPAPSSAAADTPLVVNDAAAANPNLVMAQLQVPDGFQANPLALQLPPGFSIELLAAGLRAPRFMAFDAAGNLLVADQRAGNVYRYPAGDGGAIQPAATPPQPLASGLAAPSSLAFFTADDGTVYLYVGETDKVSRFRYVADGTVGEREIVIPDLPT